MVFELGFSCKAEPETRLDVHAAHVYLKVILGTRNEGLRRVGQKRKTGQLKSMLSRSLLWAMELDSTWTFHERAELPLKDETLSLLCWSCGRG